MKRFAAVTVIGVAVLIGYWATTGAMRARAAAEKKVAGSSQRAAAPDFTVTALDGKAIRLSALKGKVVILDFWATWCPPCKAEIPHFIELQNAYGPKGLEIIGLSVDQEGPEVVRAFVRENGVNYAMAMAGPELVQLYGGIRGIPTTFLLDKEGRVAKKLVGYQDKQVFESQIRVLLDE